MNLLDMHCDTLYRLYFNKKESASLKNNHFQVDLERLNKIGAWGQFFALYYNIKSPEYQKRGSSPWKLTEEIIKMALKEFANNSDMVKLLLKKGDLYTRKKENKPFALLSVEGGELLECSKESVSKAYDYGVRAVGLIWNHENDWGYPASLKEHADKGLKKSGREVIEFFNEKGILIDVSHLNDKGTEDVLKISQKPIIASHSNAKSLLNHPRNLNDKLIKGIADKGGVIGLNFCSAFLDGSDTSKVDDLVRHALYIIDKGGIESLGIGTDFDGISSKLEINGVGEMGKLREALKSRGVNDFELEKILYKNTLRVLEEVLV